jgi:hypothetical protein
MFNDRSRFKGIRSTFARFLLVPIVAVLFLHCGTTGYNTYDMPCGKPRNDVVTEARNILAKLGLEQKTAIPDSGYFRTKALKVQSVSEGDTPRWFMVEMHYTGSVIQVGAFELVPDGRSEARRMGTSPEDDANTEEVLLRPGDRFFLKVVQPFMDRMKEWCAQ